MFTDTGKTSLLMFRVLAAATGNARSPILESCVSGTASAKVDDECRHCDCTWHGCGSLL